MCRFLMVPVFVSAVAGGCVLAALAAPERTRAAGLDFWNHPIERARLRDHDEHRRELDLEELRILKRNAVCDQIALGWCDGRLSFQEALADTAELAECNPRWFATVRCQDRFLGLPDSASDRAVLTLLLRKRIDLIRQKAARVGDSGRVTFVSTRLSQFDEEARGALRPDPQTAGKGK